MLTCLWYEHSYAMLLFHNDSIFTELFLDNFVFDCLLEPFAFLLHHYLELLYFSLKLLFFFLKRDDLLIVKLISWENFIIKPLLFLLRVDTVSIVFINMLLWNIHYWTHIINNIFDSFCLLFFNFLLLFHLLNIVFFWRHWSWFFRWMVSSGLFFVEGLIFLLHNLWDPLCLMSYSWLQFGRLVYLV